jgi:hypothetical protein
MNENATRDIRACDVTCGDVTYKRRDALRLDKERRRPILLAIMQQDLGSSHSFDKKRKAIEGSSSVVDTSVRIKRTKTVNQWPDYFIEVSAREGGSKLTPGTSLVSVVQGI